MVDAGSARVFGQSRQGLICGDKPGIGSDGSSQREGFIGVWGSTHSQPSIYEVARADGWTTCTVCCVNDNGNAVGTCTDATGTHLVAWTYTVNQATGGLDTSIASVDPDVFTGTLAGMNASGKVVGKVEVKQKLWFGANFRMSAATDLPGVDAGLDGGVTAINDAGEIAGYVQTVAGGVVHACKWVVDSTGPTVYDLVILKPAGPASYASGISDTGMVCFWDAGGTNGAVRSGYLLPNSATIVPAKVPGGYDSVRLCGFDAANNVYGVLESTSNGALTHAYCRYKNALSNQNPWSVTDIVADARIPGPVNCIGCPPPFVNDIGRIVQSYQWTCTPCQISDDHILAAVPKPQYRLIDLGLGTAHGLNNNGVVVGEKLFPITGEVQPVGYSWDVSSGTPVETSLGTPAGADGSVAVGINDAGNFVGYATYKDVRKGWDGTIKGKSQLVMPSDPPSGLYGINSAGHEVGDLDGSPAAKNDPLPTTTLQPRDAGSGASVGRITSVDDKGNEGGYITDASRVRKARVWIEAGAPNNYVGTTIDTGDDPADVTAMLSTGPTTVFREYTPSLPLQRLLRQGVVSDLPTPGGFAGGECKGSDHVGKVAIAYQDSTVLSLRQCVIIQDIAAGTIQPVQELQGQANVVAAEDGDCLMNANGQVVVNVTEDDGTHPILADPILPGDADGDHVVTAADAAIALRIAGGHKNGSITYISPCDVYPAGGGDGVVDIRDALRIARKAAGLETVWP